MHEDISWTRFIEIVVPAFFDDNESARREEAWRSVRQLPDEKVYSYIARKNEAFKFVCRDFSETAQISALVTGLDEKLYNLYQIGHRGADPPIEFVHDALRALEAIKDKNVGNGGLPGQRLPSPQISRIPCLPPGAPS